MKTTTRLLAVFILFSLFYSCKKEDISAKEGTPGNNSTLVYNVDKATMLQLVNEVRATGCTCGTTNMPAVAAVTWNDVLAKAAYDHSVDMKTNNYFSHTGLDGSSPGDRLQAAGYNWQAYGENIAAGYSSEEAVMDAWLHSEGHCKNIMSADFREMGAGREGNYWTQDFGTRQ